MMAGNIKLLTSAGGGVFLDTATTTATDVTVKVPVTGVNNGTLACTDANGNLGLGVTPSAWRSTYKALDVGTRSAFTDDDGPRIWGNSFENSSGQSIYKVTGPATQYYAKAGIHTWHTAPSGTAGNAISFTQAMTLDSSGNLLVGCTSVPSASVAGAAFVKDGSNGTDLYVTTNTTVSNRLIWFYNPNGLVGGIVTDASSTIYSTSSDYRLKENIQPMQNALAVVQQLNPVTYTWKADGSDGQGFIAHELQAVVPDCVTGEKDAVDAEGNPVYQGIDTSFLVATLTKAIQEQQAQIETLTAKVAALEAK